MNVTTTKSPWLDDADLAMVKDWFYPSYATKDPYNMNIQDDMRKEAVAKVNIWTFKSHRVPPTIISTADLTDSILHYEDMARNNDPDSYRAVQFMFAFAFLRFVNSFVDRDIARTASSSLATSEVESDDEGSSKAKAAGESSMYAHAITIGMPSRFVDLRHQVSHGQLPDIKVLKKAAEDGLVWLWDRWWKSKATADPVSAVRRFEVRKEQRKRMAIADAGLEQEFPL